MKGAPHKDPGPGQSDHSDSFRSVVAAVAASGPVHGPAVVPSRGRYLVIMMMLGDIKVCYHLVVEQEGSQRKGTGKRLR